MATSYINESGRDGVWDAGEQNTTWDADDKMERPADDAGNPAQDMGEGTQANARTPAQDMSAGTPTTSGDDGATD